MQVPFDKIGPGQSGRFVYQVMGEDGPIFNPTRIRYLSPDQVPGAGNQPVGLPSAFTSLAALNLAASVGAVTVSAMVLKQVHQLHRKMDQALFKLDSIETSVDRLVQQVQRIDARVSENNLRHALDYILKRAVQGDQIDLRELARVKNDLETFSQGIEGGFTPCNAFGLRLSSDVEDRLEAIYKLLFGIRYFIYTQHNLIAQGDPLRTLSIDLIDDYLSQNVASPALAASGRLALQTMWDAQQELAHKVYSDFTFADETTANEYSTWLGDNVLVPVVGALESADDGALQLALDWEFDASDQAEASAYYDQLRLHWLWHTSAGLLWRTYLETLGLTLGYNDTWGLKRERVEPLESSMLLLCGPVEQTELDRVLGSVAR